MATWPMYGVPHDLPLDRFVGKTIDCISISKFWLTLDLGSSGSIAIQGGWEVRDSSGIVVDSRQDHGERDSYRIYLILGIPIASFVIDAHSLTLIFESGHSLEIFDDDQHYESFQVDFGGGSPYVI